MKDIEKELEKFVMHVAKDCKDTRKRSRDFVVRDSLIECFVTHADCLMSYFVSEYERGIVATIRDFVELGKKWEDAIEDALDKESVEIFAYEPIKRDINECADAINEILKKSRYLAFRRFQDQYVAISRRLREKFKYNETSKIGDEEYQ